MPEDRREVAERYRAWEQSEAVAGGLETRIRSRQGDLKRVHVRAGSLLFEGKRSVIATVRDVTRERHMEHEIKDHAERLAAINEIAGAVNQSLTIEDIFSVAAQEARRIVPFDRLTIALSSGDPAEARSSWSRWAAGSRRERAPFAAQDVAWAFERPTAWCEGEAEAPPFATALFRASPTRALATRAAALARPRDRRAQPGPQPRGALQQPRPGGAGAGGAPHRDRARQRAPAGGGAPAQPRVRVAAGDRPRRAGARRPRRRCCRSSRAA